MKYRLYPLKHSRAIDTEQLTASVVPGKNTMVRTARAFIAELSSPLALATTRLEAAISWLIMFALWDIWLSLWAIKLHTFGIVLSIPVSTI